MSGTGIARAISQVIGRVAVQAAARAVAKARRRREACQPPGKALVTLLETKKYMLLRLLLSNSIDPTMASTTRPRIKEYSIAVAPPSSFRNLIRLPPIPKDYPNHWLRQCLTCKQRGLDKN